MKKLKIVILWFKRFNSREDSIVETENIQCNKCPFEIYFHGTPPKENCNNFQIVTFLQNLGLAKYKVLNHFGI